MARLMVIASPMKTFLLLAAAAIAAPVVMGGPAIAQPAGQLETLPLGQYRCSVPGSAAGQAWVPVSGIDFVIGNASSYTATSGSGTYLATAKTVTFTRGPMKGAKFARRMASILQKYGDEGKLSRVRCVREGPAR